MKGTWILLLAAACQAQGPVQDDHRTLVEDLGDPDWYVREDAARSLQALGQPAYPALRWGEDHDDPEVRWRSGAIAESIRQEEERRLLSIPRHAEMAERRRGRVNLLLFRTEAGHYSGETTLLPVFRYAHDRKAERYSLDAWPLVTWYRKSKAGTRLYSIPLLFFLNVEEEPGRITATSLPLFYYRHSEGEGDTRLYIPLLLSGFIDTRQTRAVSIFPLLFHHADKRSREETLYIWPLLCRFQWSPEVFSVGDIFSFFFSYRTGPEGQDLSFFRLLTFRWGGREEISATVP